MFLGMGVPGWLAALAIGFVVGGVFFLSMRAQVDYVVSGRGADWVAPAILYARMALMATALVVTALAMPRQKLGAAAIAGLSGAGIARVLIARQVKRGDAAERDGEDHG